MFFVGNLRPEDRGLLVRRVRRLSASDLEKSIEVFRSESGRASVYPDGLCVVGDKVEVLERVNELFDRIESADAGTWVVQFFLLSISDTDERALALDVTPAASLSAAVASAPIDKLRSTGAASATLTALLHAVDSSGTSHVVATPLLLVADGGSGSVVRGQTIPVPQTTVSAEGTVTTTGYTNVQVGLTINAAVREVSAGSADLKSDVKLSTVDGYVQSSPIQSNSEVQSEEVVSSGGVYLLGQVEETSTAESQTGGFRIGSDKTQQRDTLQVWARIFRVAGPIGADRPAGCGVGRAASGSSEQAADVALPALGDVWVLGAIGEEEPVAYGFRAVSGYGVDDRLGLPSYVEVR